MIVPQLLKIVVDQLLKTHLVAILEWSEKETVVYTEVWVTGVLCLWVLARLAKLPQLVGSFSSSKSALNLFFLRQERELLILLLMMVG